MEVVAQCHAYDRICTAVNTLRPSAVMLSMSLLWEHAELLISIKAVGAAVMLVAEPGDYIPPGIAKQVGAEISRHITVEDLLKTVRHVTRGYRSPIGKKGALPLESDPDGARVRDCLTPREMQIVALLIRACKNKEIAQRLGTKEGNIKNSLSNIFDKTGIGDRLELTLFTLNHPRMVEAANRAGSLLRAASPSPDARHAEGKE
jgi:DNA-binding NarL/FixJ family response regulator